ncbi:MAG TPA: acetyl-CoA carboxylase biotin carboxyl carrier protein [Pyrinomonadaceae bacterium]|nr:acetyl-CoA carboxylase biotin carboxyl carrier protein [Pyrinomonadaceae bacterium]
MSENQEQSDQPNRKSRSRRETPSASVNIDELRELITLMRDNGLAELELEREDFRVRLRRESAGPTTPPLHFELTSQPAAQHASAPAPAPTSSPAPTPAAPDTATTAAADQDVHVITSPIVGTFYRSPSPSADPFVKIGSNVEPETVVCIIEAMKLMNEIQAETIGEVVKIYAENGQPVEYGEPLFGIKPQ